MKFFKVNKYGQIDLSESKTETEKNGSRITVRLPFVIALAILILAVFVATLFLH